MPPRQPLPRLILMTDERMGDRLWAALARLPRGAGVIFRHYRTPPIERRVLYERVRRVARARGLWLILAGSPAQAIGWRADGAHGTSLHRRAARPLLRSAPVHDAIERVAARRQGAQLVLISPVFPTRSHEGARGLGVVRFGLLARNAGPLGRKGVAKPPGWEPQKRLALGGVTPARYKRLQRLGADGWAAIDAWTPGDQNLKVVPR
jgi:thiamine-phosphate pyrophosphorylase